MRPGRPASDDEDLPLRLELALRERNDARNAVILRENQAAERASALDAAQVQAAAWKARALAAERQLREARVLADQLYGALGVIDSEA